MFNNVFEWMRRQWSRFFSKGLMPEDAAKVMVSGHVCSLDVCREVLGLHRSPFCELPVPFTRRQLKSISFLPNVMLFTGFASLEQVAIRNHGKLTVQQRVLGREKNPIGDPAVCLVSLGFSGDLPRLNKRLRSLGLMAQCAPVTMGVSALAIASSLGLGLSGTLKMGTRDSTAAVELGDEVPVVRPVPRGYNAKQIIELRSLR